MTNGFHSDSVSWQLHDRDQVELAKHARWMDRVFANIREAMSEAVRDIDKWRAKQNDE